MLIPLAIINHFKPTRELPGLKATARALSAGHRAQGFHACRATRGFSPGGIFSCAPIDALKLISQAGWRPMRRRALEEAERWMLERIGEGSDGLAAVFPAMLNSLIALRALGYSNDHPIYEKAAKDFAGLFVDDPEDFRIQPCLSPVWDTAINIIALAESGLPAEHPALTKRGRLAGGERSADPRRLDREQSASGSRAAGPSNTTTFIIPTRTTPRWC